jgi:hypothetical protein
MTIAYSQQRRTASKSTRRKPSTKRKKKFGSGSDIEHLDTVVHVPKRPKSTSHTPVSSLRARPLVSKENLSGAHEMRVLQCSHKKARLPSSISSAANVIPSSQSDELEMVLPGVIKKDPGETEDSVNEWRKSTLNSPGASLMSGHDTAANANMNVDVPVSSPLSEPESLNIASRPDTPERRPNLPAALDVESKTAQIIAQIKADAYAAACSSPEPVTSEFKSLDEDSGDEDDLNLFLIKPENHK